MSAYLEDNKEQAFSHINGQHYPDTYKKPNHPTFSDESIYSTKETPGGHWGYQNGKDVFYPSEWQIETFGNNYILDGMKQQGDSDVIPVRMGGVMLPEVTVTHQYKDGGESSLIGTIRHRLATNINPFNYTNPISRVFNAVVRNKKEDTRQKLDNWVAEGLPGGQERKYRLAAWSKYLGSPIEGINNDDYITKSQYTPRFSKNADAVYYTYKPTEGHDIFDAFQINSGNFTIGYGQDQKGTYYSLYDIWDINPFGGANSGDASLGIGNPFEVYDRIYYQDSPDAYNKAQTFYRQMLEEQGKKEGDNVVVKYKDGGSIHIAPSKKGTFTAAATKHGKSVQAFASQVLANKENYSPAMVKKANFARNFGSHKGANGMYLDTKTNTKTYNDAVNYFTQLGFKGKNASDLALQYTVDNMQYDAGTLPEVTITPNVQKRIIIDNGTKNVHHAPHTAPVQESTESKIAAGMIGIPLISTQAVPVLGEAMSEAMAARDAFRLAHPYVSALNDITWTNLGLHDLATDNGIAKTKRLIDEGKKGRAFLSGLGDAANALGAFELFRVGSKIANPAYRRAWAYHKIPQYGYQGTIERTKDWINGMLSGVTPNVKREAAWVDDLRKELKNKQIGYLEGLWQKNPDAAIEIFVRGRDEASRLYNQLPSRHNYYLRNADGSYRYNLDQIQKDWQTLSGEKEFPISQLDFYSEALKNAGHHGVDVITGAGGNLTGNEFIARQSFGPIGDKEEFGIKLIQDWQDAHPFRRSNRQFSNWLQKSVIDKKMDKVRNWADSMYTSIYDTLNKGQDWGQSPLGEFWYNWLGGRQLNQLRHADNPRLPGYHYNKEAAEWVPGEFWQKINSKMADFEVGSITGAKPFLMKTEIPYTIRRKYRPHSELELHDMKPDAIQDLVNGEMVLGHHSSNYVIPDFTTDKLLFGMSQHNFNPPISLKSTGGPLYSSAMVKKANFARNFGGHRHEDGGLLVDKEDTGMEMVDNGTNNNRPQDQPQISWIENWLNSRKDIMAKNIADTEFGNRVIVYSPKNNTGDVRDAGFNADYNFPIYNPLYWFLGQNPRIKQAEKIINREVQNIKNVPVTNVGNEYKPSYGMLGTYVIPSHWDNSGNYIAFLGTPKDEVKIHEFTHASNPRPQENYIEQVLYKDENIPNSIPGIDKLTQAKELYGALQEVRYKSGLKPNVVVDEQWLKNNKKYFENTYLEGLPNNILIRLFNEVAQNSSSFKKSDNTYLAALGGNLKSWKNANGGYLDNLTTKPFSYQPIPEVRYKKGGFLKNTIDWLSSLFGLNQDETQQSEGIDLREIAARQAYAESGFDSNAKSNAGAMGLFQIMPSVLQDYNTKNNNTIPTDSLINDSINTNVRNWYMNDLMNRGWNTKNNPSDSVRVAKALGAYNWGSGNLVNALNKAKADGIDIYNSWDWLPYLAPETRDYIDFILMGNNNSLHRNNIAYKKKSKQNQEKVDNIKKSFAKGGNLNSKNISNKNREIAKIKSKLEQLAINNNFSAKELKELRKFDEKSEVYKRAVELYKKYEHDF